MGRKGWMLSVSPWVFKILGNITGKSEVVDRLCGSLKVDITKTKELLNWTPPFTVKEGFSKTVKHFLKNK
jgi:nucleoside-diphosphate-sugar epimerase